MDTRPPGYERTQTFRLLWLVLPLATLLASAVMLDETQGRGAPVPLVAWFVTLGMPALALLLLGRLTIQVDAQRVRWHFGFLGWPRWSVALADIAHVETTQLRWWEGQGIRFTFDGRLYNVASGGAVRLTLHDGKRIRLGSDEPERLAAWIGHRIGSG